VNATSAGIILSFIDKVEAFARRRPHLLLFVVGSCLQLLMGSNCGDNFAGLVGQMSTFEVRLSGRSGDGCGSEEFA